MANAQRGEVSAIIGGVERKVCFSARAIASIETDLGAPIGKLLPMLEHGSINLLVSVLQRAIRPAMSKDQAFDYLDEGGIQELSDPIGKALTVCGLFSSSTESSDGGGKPTATAKE